MSLPMSRAYPHRLDEDNVKQHASLAACRTLACTRIQLYLYVTPRANPTLISLSCSGSPGPLGKPSATRCLCCQPVCSESVHPVSF